MDMEKIMAALVEYTDAVKKAGEEDEAEADSYLHQQGSLFGKSEIQKNRDKRVNHPLATHNAGRVAPTNDRRKGSRSIV